MGKLITFSPSADCELSRWILRYHNEAYTEYKHTFPFIVLSLKLNGGKDFPLYIRDKLVFDKVRPIIDHFETLVEANKKLIPSAYASEIETCWRNFNTTLGSAVVTWAYANLLPYKAIMIRPLSLDCPWYERLVVKYFYNVPKSILWNALKLSKASADEALIVIDKSFSEVDHLLADGRKYLFGDRLTLADMAFAVSGAPLVLPANYGGDQFKQGAIPTFDEFPKELQEIIRAKRETTAGKFILRLYTEDRYRDRI
ncbi:MAG: glutathione S-transferase C-terminal domain-containing protein [Nitrosomonas sp.]|nr:glutathione S-transferase C-terminal domain-containing protein [Nitrosomonas sp.]